MTLGRFHHQGYALGYEVHGEGERVIVLTNGLLLDAGVNRQLARSLAAQGFRVVLLDLLGHGTSDKPHHATQHRMDRYARQVVALLDELGVQRAVVGGVSLGANVSLHVAVQAPSPQSTLAPEQLSAAQSIEQGPFPQRSSKSPHASLLPCVLSQMSWHG